MTRSRYRARLGTLSSEGELQAEQQRLRQRAARSEREGIRQLNHAKYLQHKHEEALKEASRQDRQRDAGQPCPVCLQVVDEGLLMQCGHFFCSACTDQLLAEPRPQCGLCRARISRRSLFRVSGQAASSSGGGLGKEAAGDQMGAELGSIRVRGDWGTKINALVRFLKFQEQQHAAHRQAGGEMGRAQGRGPSGMGVADEDDLAVTHDAFRYYFMIRTETVTEIPLRFR
jgi:hypothetical protein